MNNIFEAIPENIDVEIFERLVESKGVRIERIVSKSHTSSAVDWYDQEERE